MSWHVHLDSLLRYGHMGYRMYVMREEYDRSFSVMFNPTMRSYRAGELSREDEYFLADSQPGVDVRSFLQAVSDAAWEIGIKPKQLENQTNELSAVRYHLEDMRKLAKVR